MAVEAEHSSMARGSEPLGAAAHGFHGDNLALVGAEAEVPLADGRTVRYVNLDYAASTPPLEVVAAAVEALLPWYSSVHRGAGYKSRLSTAIYEGARESVRTFFNARPDDAVIFTRNTTDALNLLAHSLPDGPRVIAIAGVHHAIMLPRRRHAVTYLPVPEGPEEALQSIEDAMRQAVAPGPVLVTVTGASNVTGEIWPIERISEIVHQYGGHLALDAAQLAPHYPIDVAALDVDFLAMSGHKIYAPYGSGVLLGRPAWLSQGDPFLAGGGAVDFVTLTTEQRTDLPARQEAGSPNVVGAAALGAACDVLAAAGMAWLADEETELRTYAVEQLQAIPGVEVYGTWGPNLPRVGIAPFNLEGYPHALLAEILSAEYGSGVRHGCFCAHPLVMHLLHVDEESAERIQRSIKCTTKPGAVRMSMGLGTTRADLDRLAEALRAIANHGPRWSYQKDDCDDVYTPTPDPRAWPDLPFRLGQH